VNAERESATTEPVAITTTQILLICVALFFLNLILRVFYLRYDFVNGDEGVRALSAVRMLEGARLYADVVTDKPPGASLFYAAVFALFGRSMKAVHLAAIVWNFATSVVVYLIAARFYNRRAGLWAALLFVYFSTNYFTQDTMAANTELLMALPYAASFLFFMTGHSSGSRERARSAYVALIIAGVLTGFAALFKQVGVLNLAFFAVYEIFELWNHRKDATDGSMINSVKHAVLRLSLVGVGFAAVIGGFILWLFSMGALAEFWRNGIVLNMFYIDSEPAGLWIKFGVGRGLGYVFFNATLWTLAAWAVLHSIKKARRDGASNDDATSKVRFDLAIALWAAVTLVGVIMSGRFFGHYFIPALPALSLLAARGVSLFAEALETPAHKRRAQVALMMLSILFLIGLVRSHHRTAVLAYETVTGTRTRWSANWGMTKREEEAEIVSAFVREKIPRGEPLYIWGYAHDVYWRTGCRPASRYLTPYYIDGRFADAESAAPISGENFRREAAANLLEDLKREKPRLILDVGGGFKRLEYADLVDYVDRNYRDGGSIGVDPSNPFRVLERKEGASK
jgi:4-amino-4-deoxy-L-arabinose transferase-like glycosyltransferase